MSPIRVSILGAGSALSALHNPSITSMPDKFVVHSVLERTDKGRARAACGARVKVVRTLEEVVGDKDVDLVVVASPNNTHFEYASAAIAAGKHVLVEKPICPTAAEAQRLVELAKAKGVILSVYQNRRWDSDFLTVRKLLSEGTLGDINEFESHFDRYRPLPPSAASWKETPGEHNDVIYNLGSHLIDQAYVLFGMPERVGCRCWDMRRIGVDEGFVMDLYYPPSTPSASPLFVTLRTSYISPLPSDQQLRFLIKGSRGTFTKRGSDPQGEYNSKVAAGEEMDEALKPGEEAEEMWGEVWAGEEREGTEWKNYRYPSVLGDWPALYHNLYEAITSGNSSRLDVKPEQAVDVLKIIEMGVRSSREGRVFEVK